MFNIEKRMRENEAARQRKEAYREEKQAYINNIFNTVGSVAGQGEKYDVLNMLSDDYMITKGKWNRPNLRVKK